MTAPRALPKLAIINRELGVPSEIWVQRQARGLTGFDPTLWGWSHAADPVTTDLPQQLIASSFPEVVSLRQKVLRKLGQAAAYDLNRGQAQALRQLFQQEQPDLALVHFGWNAVAVAQVLPADVPMVVHIHGRDASMMLGLRAYRTALRRALKRAAAVVVVGSHQQAALAPLGLPERVERIPCGAPLDLFAAQPLPDQPEASAESPVRFVTIGRLSDEKGMRESLAAFDQARHSLPGCHLTMIGYGPLHEVLARDIAARGLEGQVTLTGRLSPEEIAATLARSHVYLQHSREHHGWIEGFGVTLTEAGAAGLPLIASASGGLRDQITEGENGFLFAPDDSAAQAAHMITLGRDAALRRQMGARARDMAGRFDSTRMTRQLDVLLRDVLNQHRAQTGPRPA